MAEGWSDNTTSDPERKEDYVLLPGEKNTVSPLVGEKKAMSPYCRASKEETRVVGSERRSERGNELARVSSVIGKHPSASLHLPAPSHYMQTHTVPCRHTQSLVKNPYELL